MLKIAPTLIVEKVEPSLAFFIEYLGFKKVAEVGEANDLAFALLARGPFEIHLQSLASASKDIPYFAGAKIPPASFLYIDVENVAVLYERLKRLDVLLPLEKTFYGATHFFIKEPGGHVLGFSQNH